MRAQWEAVYAGLTQSLLALHATTRFRDLLARAPILALFADARTLLAFLTDPASDIESRNATYRALVARVQARDDDADAAMVLLWLGLWPPLDAIFRRQLRFRRSDPDDLVGEIADCFSDVVHRADLTRITRLAVTLTRNTEHMVRERNISAYVHARRQAEMGPNAGRVDRDVAPPPELSAFGLPASLPFDEQTQALRALLVPIIGDDADLVIGAHVDGESRHDLAYMFGISHGAVRMRLSRALSRLREHFASVASRATP